MLRRIEQLFFLPALMLAAHVYAHSDATSFAEDRDHGQGREGVGAVTGMHVDKQFIRVAEVEERAIVEDRAGIGTIVAPQSSTHDANSFISGQIKEVYVRAGSLIRKGDPIALIESPEFVLTQKAYIALMGNNEKLDILEGEGRLGNYLQDARENLSWWGLDEDDIQHLEDTGVALEGITVRAEVDGVISEVLVQPGDLLNSGDRNMATFVVMGQAIARIIQDDKPLWVVSLMYWSDVAGVRADGVRMKVYFPGGRTEEYPVASLSPSLDRQRRLVQVMAKLDERDGLYPGQPVKVELLLPRQEKRWLPRAALMRQGFAPVVFIQDEQGGFVRRAVEVGAGVGDWVPVSGLDAGTKVVTHGKMALEGAYRLLRADTRIDDHHH